MMHHFLNRFWTALLICPLLFSYGKISTGTSLYAYELPKDFTDLPRQDKAVIRDLILLNFPPFDWRKENNKPHPQPMYDVVIIGGGMAGLTAGTALFKEGIFNIKLFDQNSTGLEGPWATYARMKTLRSSKEIMGPGLGIPHLTFHAWFEALFGAEAWRKLVKIPNHLWMDYLKWYREVMQLPIENSCTLTHLIPLQEEFELHFQQEGKPLIVRARKVILATGRAGFGGPTIPEFAQHLPKSICAHTMDQIDFNALKNCRIGILGVGASSFDAAATALETGAKSVDLIMRRSHLPDINKFGSLPYKGFNHGYFKLSDEKRWEFMSEAFEAAIPPPIDSIKRVQDYPNLRILANTVIKHMRQEENCLQVETQRETLTYDFFILGTGFNIDGNAQPELRDVMPDIALWSDKLCAEIVNKHPKMGSFPYLGASYEFLPKEAENAPYLKNLYCYNYAATLSHGLLSGDIPAISIGATRLAQGIAADFFIQNSEWYLKSLKNYDVKDFEEKDYSLQIIHQEK